MPIKNQNSVPNAMLHVKTVMELLLRIVRHVLIIPSELQEVVFAKMVILM